MDSNAPPPTQNPIFDDAATLIDTAVHAFRQAAREAVAENDRLGITTHGAIDGRLVEHAPPRFTKHPKPRAAAR